MGGTCETSELRVLAQTGAVNLPILHWVLEHGHDLRHGKIRLCAPFCAGRAHKSWSGRCSPVASSDSIDRAIGSKLTSSVCKKVPSSR